MLSDIETQTLKLLKTQGYGNNQLIEHLGSMRTGRTSSVVQTEKFLQRQEEAMADFNTAGPRVSDIGEDIVTGGKQIFGDIKQRIEGTKQAGIAGAQGLQNVGSGRDTSFKGGQSILETVGQLGTTLPGAAFDVGFRLIQTAAKLFMTESQEVQTKEGFEKFLEKTGVPQKIANMSPRSQRNFQAVMDGLDVVSGGIASRLTGFKKTLRSGRDNTVENVFEETSNRLNEAAQDPNLTPLQKEQAAQSALSFQEKIVGITPDQKARLQEMGPEKLQEYLDVVHTRNVSDTAQTAFEYGGDQARVAVTKMEELLNETGGQIGNTRRKLGTIQAPRNSINAVETSFLQQLDNLKLTVKNGEVIKQPGVGRISSSGDLRVLNELYQELLAFKQSPTLTNLVDLRSQFDRKIKFGKSAREVSSDVQPLSTSVRTSIAKEMEVIVGKSEARAVHDYSEFIDAYNDLSSFTNRQAGGEYLLRVVQSGRGGEARKLIQTIKDHTGMDLMNDATAMSLVTDLLGNVNQKNLFRQEITKAGGDATSVIRGDIVGAGAKAMDYLIQKGIDPEDVLKKAAAGTAGVLLLTYLSDENMGIPVAGAALGLMTPGARKIAFKQIDEAIEVARKSANDVNATPATRRAAENKVNQLTKQKAELVDESASFKAGETPVKNKETTPKPSLSTDPTNFKTADEFMKAQGTPVYHGTSKKFTEFDSNFVGTGKGSNREGTWFTSNKIQAEAIGEGQASIAKNTTGKIETPNVLEVFINAKKPKTIDVKGEVLLPDKANDIIKQAKLDGHDSVLFNNVKVAGDIKANHTVAIDNSIIKTKSQLTDIWNKANGTAITPKTGQRGFAKLPGDKSTTRIELNDTTDIGATVEYRGDTYIYTKQRGVSGDQAVLKNADGQEISVPKSDVTKSSSQAKQNVYGMQHRPSESGSGFDITDSEAMPKDFYNNPQQYIFGNEEASRESIRAILKIHNKPDADVVVYRATPKNELNEGDWISLSKKYADAESLDEGVKVYDFTVKAKDIQFAGDDINEFGYFPKG